MKANLVYGTHSALRRVRLNVPAYVAFAITSILSFEAITLNQLAVRQFSAATGISRMAQVSVAVHIMFSLGITVCGSQIVLIVLRLVQDRRAELQLLSSIGWPRRAILLTVTVEYCVHVLIGSVPAAVACILFTVLSVRLSDANSPGGVSSLAIASAWAIAMPLIATLPITSFYAATSLGEGS